jgi:hypothetical protein
MFFLHISFAFELS